MTSAEIKKLRESEQETVATLRGVYDETPTIDLVWLQHCLVLLIESRKTPALLQPKKAIAA